MYGNFVQFSLNFGLWLKIFCPFFKGPTLGVQPPLFLGVFFIQKLPNLRFQKSAISAFWPVFGTEKKYRTHEGKVDPNFLELPSYDILNETPHILSKYSLACALKTDTMATAI